MCYRDPRGDRAEQVVVVAVAAPGLVADLEAVGQRLEDAHHLVDGADLGTADDLPGLAEDADGDALVVDIETDVEHGCLLKSMYLGNAATVFQVTRLTGASFIASTPKHLRGLPLAPRWPDQLQCCRTWLSSEPLSPAAGDRGPRRFARFPAVDQGLDPGIRGDLGGQKAHSVPKAPIEATNHGERPDDPRAWRQRNIKPHYRTFHVGTFPTFHGRAGGLRPGRV